MDVREQKSARAFVAGLTQAEDEAINEYLAEIKLNREFAAQLQNNRNTRGSGWGWGWGVGSDLGAVLYTLCRIMKPLIVVETGVASGESSSYFLAALDKNGKGKLYSIDPGWPGADGEQQPGWTIPDSLRRNWQFIRGEAVEELPGLLEKLREIDVFMHDSDHSYRNMLWEYKTAWSRLKTGGLLLSHNIDANRAFAEFSRGPSVRSLSLANLGGMVKP